MWDHFPTSQRLHRVLEWTVAPAPGAAPPEKPSEGRRPWLEPTHWADAQGRKLWPRLHKLNQWFGSFCLRICGLSHCKIKTYTSQVCFLEPKPLRSMCLFPIPTSLSFVTAFCRKSDFPRCFSLCVSHQGGPFALGVDRCPFPLFLAPVAEYTITWLSE